MEASDVIWRLVAAGVLTGPAVAQAREVLDVSERELKAARARYECPDVEAPVVSIPRLGISPRLEPVGTVAPPRFNRPTARWTDAGRRRAADRAFVSLRVASFICDICGQAVHSGDVVVIDRAHHAGCA